MQRFEDFFSGVLVALLVMCFVLLHLLSIYCTTVHSQSEEMKQLEQENQDLREGLRKTTLLDGNDRLNVPK